MKKTLFLALITIATWSCSDFKVTKTDEGDRIIFHEDEDGELPKEGYMMLLDMMIKDSNDTIYRNSFLDNAPIELELRKGGFVGSFENAIFHLTKGDSCTILVPADSIFMRMGQGLPPNVKSGTDLKFTVKIKDVMSSDQYQEFRKKMGAEEDQKLAAFVKQKYPQADTLADTGIFIQTSKTGKGAKPQAGDMVRVYYKGTLMSGEVFDQVQEGQDPLQFPVGVGRVIPGWDLAVMSMSPGQKSTVLIPSRLAYGSTGAGGVIPPNASLVFEIELIDFQSSK